MIIALKNKTFICNEKTYLQNIYRYYRELKESGRTEYKNNIEKKHSPASCILLFSFGYKVTGVISSLKLI